MEAFVYVNAVCVCVCVCAMHVCEKASVYGFEPQSSWIIDLNDPSMLIPADSFPCCYYKSQHNSH